MSKPGIKCIDLTVRYRSDGENIIPFKNLNFELEKGCFGVLVGPSGCGKTSFLLAVSNLLKSGSDVTVKGEVWLLGEEPAKLKQNRDISLAFQSPSLLPWATVNQNVLLPYKFGDSAERAPQKRTDELLSELGIFNKKETRPGELSGGQVQRVNLARALVSKPRVLLLDEPFVHLDYPTQLKLLKTIRHVHNEWSITTLMVTHDLREASRVGDYVYIMSSNQPEKLKEYNIRSNYKFKPDEILDPTVASEVEEDIIGMLMG